MEDYWWMIPIVAGFVYYVLQVIEHERLVARVMTGPYYAPCKRCLEETPHHFTGGYGEDIVVCNVCDRHSRDYVRSDFVEVSS